MLLIILEIFVKILGVLFLLYGLKMLLSTSLGDYAKMYLKLFFSRRDKI